MAVPGDFATIFQRETSLSWQEFSSINLEIGATPKLFPSRIVPNWEGIREVNIFLPELFSLKDVFISIKILHGGGWCGKGVVYLTVRGVQLILAYIWARPTILVAGKGRGGMLIFLLFHSCSSLYPVPLFPLIYCLFCLLFSLSGRQHKMTYKGWCVVKPQHTH